MYRVEDKYMCSETDMLMLQSKLSTVLRSDNNQTNDQGYCITSVYFDDYGDSHLEDTEEGYRLRDKYRIRIYNHTFSTVKLEVKYKRDSRIYKKSQNISVEQMNAFLNGETVVDESPSMQNPITLFNLAISETGLRPKVIVEYDRKAFVYDPGNVRITLDRNIRTDNDIEKFKRGEYGHYSYLKELDQVLEVKYDEFLPGFLAGILESGNMNQISYSKYRLCRLHMRGEL